MGEQLEQWNDVRDITFFKRMEIGFNGMKEKWKGAKAEFIDDTLKICGHPVMEGWEDSYMRQLAEIATMRGGIVLELGFGLGISAGYIQGHSIEEHIIIEANKEVYEKALQFAKDTKLKTIVLFGFWEDVTKILPDESISGILFDTYPLTEKEIHQNHFSFFSEAYRLLRPGGALTYYSDEIEDFSVEHIKRLQEAGFKNLNSKVCAVQPPKDCEYWKSDTIMAPIIIK